MTIQIDPNFCAGCGVCVETCPVGAIRLVNYLSVLDENRCTNCGACVDACPNGAITAIPIQVQPVPALALTNTRAGIPAITAQATQRLDKSTSRSISSAAGAVVAFLGSELAPRVVDLVIASLERKLAQPPVAANASIQTSPRGSRPGRRGRQKQVRHRGGCR